MEEGLQKVYLGLHRRLDSISDAYPVGSDYRRGIELGLCMALELVKDAASSDQSGAVNPELTPKVLATLCQQIVDQMEPYDDSEDPADYDTGFKAGFSCGTASGVGLTQRALTTLLAGGQPFDPRDGHLR